MIFRYYIIKFKEFSHDVKKSGVTKKFQSIQEISHKKKKISIACDI